MGTTLGPSTKRPPTSTRHRALRLQCRLPSLLPLLAASMVSQQIELVLHQHAKRLPEQHTALETCQSTTPPWKLVKLSFMSNCSFGSSRTSTECAWWQLCLVIQTRPIFNAHLQSV